MVTDGVMHDGHVSTMLGLRGWPAEGEELIVAGNILLAERTGARGALPASECGRQRPVVARGAPPRGAHLRRGASPSGLRRSTRTRPWWGSDTFWAADGGGLLPGRALEVLPVWPKT